MSRAQDRLTTTSYALLGQLALRPWTAYDLAAEVHRNLRYFVPRAESHVYAELKRLRSMALASASREYIGRRPRTTYSITPRGRRVLRSWLSAPASPPVLQHEILLRVLLAPVGDKQQLVDALERAILDTDELLNEVRPRIAREYRENRAPFQEHIHVRQFVFEFITEFHLLLKRWAIDALDVVETWEDLLVDGKQQGALHRIEREAKKQA